MAVKLLLSLGLLKLTESQLCETDNITSGVQNTQIWHNTNC